MGSINPSVNLNTAVMNLPQPLDIPVRGFRPQTPRVGYICSVHYQPVFATRKHGGLRTDYYLPGHAEMGQYSVLPVYDTFQLVQVTVEEGNKPPAMEAMPIPLEVVGEKDLVPYWTSGFFGRLEDRKPGIGVIAGPKPTPDELEALLALQREWDIGMVQEGDDLFHDPKRGQPNNGHRAALRHLGSEDIEHHPWYRTIRPMALKRSAATGKDIPMNAFTDPENGVDLVELYLKYNLNPEDFGDTHLAPFVKERRSVSAKKGS